MGAASSAFTGALFRGLAQLAFCDSALAGVLVLAGLALVSPWGAAGAVAGTVFGTAVGYFASVYSREEWEHGLAGLNGAVVGIIWGGFIADGSFNLPLFLTILSVCVALEFVLRRALARVSLPALSMPAVATAVLTSWVLAAPGTISAQLTPRSFESLGIAVDEIAADRIDIVELFDGSGSYDVHFLVHAVRRGFEDYQPVISEAELAPWSSGWPLMLVMVVRRRAT